jgi:GrpB-like predicted nucleotidyltransferase (UPF0157 family)
MNQESVEISPYNPEWPRIFECEKKILHEVAGVWLMGSIEHIGSTSIPGLASKPVIDIMFGVQSLENSLPAIDVIVNSGYEYFPYKKDVMHWFCKPSHKHRTHHLHLVPFQSKLWNDRIQFREILLTNENIAEEYLYLKQELAVRYKYDREGYTEEKWPFIEQVLKRLGGA